MTETEIEPEPKTDTCKTCKKEIDLNTLYCNDHIEKGMTELYKEHNSDIDYLLDYSGDDCNHCGFNKMIENPYCIICGYNENGDNKREEFYDLLEFDFLPNHTN